MKTLEVDYDLGAVGGGQMPASPLRLMILGGAGGTHVGDSLRRAAVRLGYSVQLVNVSNAFAASRIRQWFYWHLLDRMPADMPSFEKHVLASVFEWKPHVLLTTGIAPLGANALQKIATSETICINFSTDDPWNPAHKARWFLRALKEYHCVFTPRKVNVGDFIGLGVKNVHYVRFGYDPEIFYPLSASELASASAFGDQVVFAGGADRDRIPYIEAFLRAGIGVALYGDIWRKNRKTRRIARGQADARTLRLAIGSSKVALCLVRRANRDGSSMRTFEVPAVGAAMLVEDTVEHREIFGEEGAAVLYFSTIEELISKTSTLLADPTEVERLARAAKAAIRLGGNTYEDRLRQMLSFALRRSES